jgi:hypothetical protein
MNETKRRIEFEHGDKFASPRWGEADFRAQRWKVG